MKFVSIYDTYAVECQKACPTRNTDDYASVKKGIEKAVLFFTASTNGHPLKPIYCPCLYCGVAYGPALSALTVCVTPYGASVTRSYE